LNKLFVRESLIAIGPHWFISVVGPNRLRNVPHMYGNLTHESKIVNPVDSFLDSVPGVVVGFGLGGEEATLEAVLVVIVSGREEHWSLAFDTFGLRRVRLRTWAKVGQ
jgi:hypothetical protein